MTIERTIPAGVRREIDRQESAEPLLAFLTITHPTIDDAIRVVADGVAFVLGGKTFDAFNFTVTVLTDTDQAPVAKLTIGNTDLRIGRALRRMDGPARMKLEVIAASEFDLTVDPRTEIATAARTYIGDQLNLVGVEADVLFITGRLQARDFSRESWPGFMATQEAFPGLFR